MKNRLDRIVTKSGDSGLTSINPNKRISKNSDVIHLLGDLDECNAYIGILKAELFTKILEKDSYRFFYDLILSIQNNLFDMGGAICSGNLKIFNANETALLSEVISKINEDLPPLKEFVLPGGSSLGAKAHVARTICRRAERSLVNLCEKNIEYRDYIKSPLLPYLNRLSDFLFVLSRRFDELNMIQESTWNKKNT